MSSLESYFTNRVVSRPSPPAGAADVVKSGALVALIGGALVFGMTRLFPNPDRDPGTVTGRAEKTVRVLDTFRVGEHTRRAQTQALFTAMHHIAHDRMLEVPGAKDHTDVRAQVAGADFYLADALRLQHLLDAAGCSTWEGLRAFVRSRDADVGDTSLQTSCEPATQGVRMEGGWLYDNHGGNVDQGLGFGYLAAARWLDGLVKQYGLDRLSDEELNAWFDAARAIAADDSLPNDPDPVVTEAYVLGAMATRGLLSTNGCRVLAADLASVGIEHPSAPLLHWRPKAECGSHGKHDAALPGFWR